MPSTAVRLIFVCIERCSLGTLYKTLFYKHQQIDMSRFHFSPNEKKDKPDIFSLFHHIDGPNSTF